MDRVTRVLLFGVGVAMLMLAIGRRRLSPVRFLRPAPPALAVTSRCKKESEMDQALASPQEGFSGISALIGAIASAVGAEQALALRAADKATLHRRKLAELRAMYVRPLDD